MAVKKGSTSTRTAGETSKPAEQRNRSKSETRKQAKAVGRAAADTEYCLMAIRDLERHMKLMPIDGWTMQQCLLHMASGARRIVEAIPVSSDQKLAKHVKVFVKESLGAVDTLHDTAFVFGSSDYDDGILNHRELQAIGVGIEQLAEKSCEALDKAACLLDPDFNPMYGNNKDIRAEFGLPEVQEVHHG